MSVLVVSWILILLSIFGLTYSREVRGESQLVQLEVERQQLRAWARSGVELALAVLERTESVGCASLGVPGPANPFAHPLACGAGRFAVGRSLDLDGREIWQAGITDEAGRLPIAVADSIGLVSLPGMTPAGASLILAARATAGESRLPPWSVLPDLDSGSRDCAERYLTHHGQAVNINSASQEVLVAVGLPAGVAGKILNWRIGPDLIVGTSDDRLFRSLESNDPGIQACLLNSEEAAVLAYLVSSGRLAVESRYFSLASRGGASGVRGICEIRAVLAKNEVGEYKVLEWTEEWIN